LGDRDATLQLNVNNLFDEKYLLSFLDNSAVTNGNYGVPRQLKPSLRMGF
jgi:outer membrane receptor protein involved in Fe transport